MSTLTRTPSAPRPSAAEVIAQLTLIAAPLLAFNAFKLPGLVTLGTVVPLAVMVVGFARTPGLRVPVWELLLMAILLGSVLWSSDPSYSTERLRTFGPLALSTVVAASLIPPATVLRSVRIAFATLIGSAVIALLVNPGARSRAASGSLVVFHAQFAKNEFGGLIVFSIVLLLGRLTRARLLLVLPLVVLLAYNRSVTGYLVAGVVVPLALVTQVLFRRLPAATARPLLVVATLMGLGSIALLLPLFRIQALLAVGKSATLSSRTQIWAASWDQIVTAPFTGFGAYTFLDPASDSPTTQAIDAYFTNKYRPPHPHNGLLDLMGQIGLLGLAAFVLLLVMAAVAGARPAQQGSEAARTGLLGLTSIVLLGITEPTYLGPWLVITFCCTAMTRDTTRDPSNWHPPSGRPAASPGPVAVART